MKQIDTFVDSVYQNVGGNKKEIQELKTEMKSHLQEAVHELVTEGKTEHQAIEIAIERFGGEKEMRSIVGQLFQAQKTFAKWVLYTGLAFLLICTISFGIIFKMETNQLSLSNQSASQILDSLGNNKEVSPQIEHEIEEIVNKSERIYGISIYDYDKLFPSLDEVERVESPGPAYSFRLKQEPNSWNNMGFLTYNGYGESNDTWHVSIESKSYEVTAIYIWLFGIAVYWTLFTIWATINAYHNRRMRVGWIIVFALFNVLGYLVYRVVTNKLKV